MCIAFLIKQRMYTPCLKTNTCVSPEIFSSNTCIRSKIKQCMCIAADQAAKLSSMNEED